MAASRDRRGCLIAAVVAAIVLVLVPVCIVSTLGFIARRNTAPWPRRAEVRLEPRRPALVESAIAPDNAFFYIRQLSDHRDVLEKGVPPPPPPPEKGAAAAPPVDFFDEKPAPAPGEATAPKPTLMEEQRRFYDYYTPGAYPLHDQWLTHLGPVFALCEQAAAAPSSQVLSCTSPDDLLPYLAPLRNAARAYSYRIEKQAYDGQWEGVVADARTALAAGRSVSHGGGLINHLVAIACDALVCSSLRRAAYRHEVPPATVTALLALLTAQEGRTDPMAEALRYELLIAQGAVDMALGKRGAGASGLFEIDPRAAQAMVFFGSSSKTMKSHMADCFSLGIRDAEQPYLVNPPGAQEMERFMGETRARMPWSLMRGDPMGRLLISMLMPALDKARAKEVLHTTTLRATALSLALRDWRREHGQPPARLDDLAPTYFATLPADPCTGAAQAPFQYRVEGKEWRLYSVGPNQRDDGGLVNLLGSNRGRQTDKEDACFDSTEFVPPPEDADADPAKAPSGNTP